MSERRLQKVTYCFLRGTAFCYFLFHMRTITAILLELHKHKTCSRMQLYRYIDQLKIEPAGARQRPQLYPDDTAGRILTHLGLNGTNGGQPNPGPTVNPEFQCGSAWPDRGPGVDTLEQLRRVRNKARAARKGGRK